jgi:hypothetical protein
LLLVHRPRTVRDIIDGQPPFEPVYPSFQSTYPVLKFHDLVVLALVFDHTRLWRVVMGLLVVHPA